jgi:hypothetical protein
VIPRSLHFCVWWLYAALELIQAKPELAPAVAKEAGEAVAVLKRIEKAIPAEYRMLPFLQEGLAALRDEQTKRK